MGGIAVSGLRPAHPTEWGTVFQQFDEGIAATLIFNVPGHRHTDGVMTWIERELSRWAARTRHRMYRRSSNGKEGITFIGFVERTNVNPHVHLAIKLPPNYRDREKVKVIMREEWVQHHPGRKADFSAIYDAAGWGRYISKENAWLRRRAHDQFVFS